VRFASGRRRRWKRSSWDIRRIRRGLAGKVAGGLFNTYLSGRGWVALVSDGQPVLLRPSEAPTFVDPQSAIAWSGSLETTFSRPTSRPAPS
jgi:uncharacterized protein (AIM24 family)